MVVELILLIAVWALGLVAVQLVKPEPALARQRGRPTLEHTQRGQRAHYDPTQQPHT
jgi:hypothetical protein